ncbi:MAG TPA: tetratricopeptide repeat protein [Acidimicrobiia bacterium]|nr:tetratricopeptide repeat protein [Acidimicrobiia bacterium]
MARTHRVRSPQRWIIEAVLVVSPLALSRAAREPVELPKAVTIALGAVLLIALWLFRMARSARLTLPTGWLPLAAVFFLASVAVSVMSADSIARGIVGPYSRWSGLALYLSFVVIAMGIIDAYRDARSLGRLQMAVMIAGGIVTGYALLQAVGADPIPWNRVYGDAVFSTHGNPNFASAYLAFVVPLAAAFALHPRASRVRRIGGALFIAGLLVAQAATQSFQGLMAAAAGTWLVGLVWLREREAGRGRTSSRIWIALGGVAVVLVVIGIFGTGPLGGFFDEALRIRRWYWEAARDMFASSPLLGVGFGEYGFYYRAFRPFAAWQAFGTFQVVDAAHNVPLGMFAEGGLFVGIAYLGVVGVVLVGLIVGLRRLQGWERLQLAGFGGAWLAYHAQSLVSIDVPQLGVVHWAMAGAIAASYPSIASAKELWSIRGVSRPALKVAAVGVAFAGLIMVTLPYRADGVVGRGARLATSNPAQAIELLSEGASMAPWEPDYWFELGQVQAGSLPAAARSFERSSVAHPRYWDGTVFAAGTFHLLGDFERAAQLWERTFDLDPVAPEVRVEAASTYLGLGDPGRAIELLEFALDLLPGQADWWLLLAEARDAVGDQEGAEAARSQAIAIDPTLGSSG